ncbi:MAG: YoaK family protein [Noviherbaspirillum sp.]
MPINYVRRLTSPNRTKTANRHLGFALAFVAGAINAGGFLAVQQYTSHMTGIVSAMADHVALGGYTLVLAGAGALLSFLMGAAFTAVLVNHARRRRLYSEYALPLLVEAILLICFGLLGARLSGIEGLFVPMTVMLLCFIMGLQNALITKLSSAEIRTTHVTGIVTDIGIELGKLFYWNMQDGSGRPNVMADRSRLTVLAILLASFFIGGVAGAAGFKYVGYLSTVPLALILIALAAVPTVDDFRALVGRMRSR